MEQNRTKNAKTEAHTAHLFEQHRTLTEYLLARGKQTRLLHWLAAAWTVVKKFHTVAFIVRLVTLLFSILETGALVLISSAVLLILLPVFALLGMGCILVAALRSGQMNRKMRTLLANQTVYLLFPTAREQQDAKEEARELAKQATVLIVSPDWFSARATKAGHFYFTATQDQPRIFWVRRYYFFSLKREVLSLCRAVIYQTKIKR